MSASISSKLPSARPKPIKSTGHRGDTVRSDLRTSGRRDRTRGSAARARTPSCAASSRQCSLRLNRRRHATSSVTRHTGVPLRAEGASSRWYRFVVSTARSLSGSAAIAIAIRGGSSPRRRAPPRRTRSNSARPERLLRCAQRLALCQRCDRAAATSAMQPRRLLAHPLEQAGRRADATSAARRGRDASPTKSTSSPPERLMQRFDHRGVDFRAHRVRVVHKG